MTLYNLARMTTDSTGTDSVVLDVAVTGYLTLDEAGVQNGDTVSYSIRTPSDSEVGTGVYTTSTKTLTRNVIKSTNGDALLNLDGNDQQVAITLLAEDITGLDSSYLKLDASNGPLTGELAINLNSEAAPTPPSATIMQILAATGNGTRFLLDAIAASGNYTTRRANTSASNPTALLSGETIGSFAWLGYGATGYTSSSRANITVSAKENWTDTEQGTEMFIGITPIGTSTKEQRLRISGVGVKIGTGAEATEMLDVGGNAKADTFISTIATGTAPLTVASTTAVSNLNADLLDGQHSSYFQPLLTFGIANTNALLVDGAGVSGQVAKWTANGLTAGALIPPATNVLTLTNAAASTLALNITAAKTLTLTAADDYTLTIPESMTVAGRNVANTFTAAQTINVNSTTALLVEQDGVKDNVLVVDTANGGVAINTVPIAFVNLNIDKDFGASATASAYGIKNQIVFGTPSKSIYNTYSNLLVNNSSGTVFFAYGQIGYATKNSVGAVLVLEGINYTTQNRGGGAATKAHGGYFSAQTIDASTTTNEQSGIYLYNAVGSGATTSSLRWITLDGLGGGTITASYGIYADTKIDLGATKYFIYSLSQSPSLLSGALTIDGTSDTQQLIVQANATQTANLTEWQNSSGTALSYITASGAALFGDKVMLTQTDGNEYIDSLADGYLDLSATTAVRINNSTADTDVVLQFVGTTSTGTFTWMEDEGYLTRDFVTRATTSLYRRYYHLPVDSFDPGAAGATWTNPTANNLSGWQLNAVGETLNFEADVHSDWDGATDLTVEISFQLLDAGSNLDTVDLKLVCYYMGNGDTATKTQTQEVATVTDGTQYKMYTATFTINFDETDNVVDAGDRISFVLNLETDTSEIDNILIVDGSFYYQTTHTYVEAGDV